MAGRISDRDMAFADEYMIDLDAKNAAIRAGYKPSTAREAYKWIDANDPAKPRLRELIEQKLAERSRRTGITADRIIREIANGAFADISDIVDLRTGRVRDDISRADTCAIASVKIKKSAYSDNVEIEIRMTDRNKALELLGKHQGMFEEKLNIHGPVPVIMDDSEDDCAEPEEKKISFQTEPEANANG